MFFEKVKNNNDFDCYAFMVDYENMGLDWPDGYETTQVQGQAPIGVNDNYLFFAKGDTLHKLDFGGFKEQSTPLKEGMGAIFNKSLEATALQNEEKENTFSQLENIISAMEVITRAKHGENDLDDMSMIMVAGGLEGMLEKLSQSQKSYCIELLNDPLPPSKNNLCKLQMHISVSGQEVTLESVLDDIDGSVFRPKLEKKILGNIDLYVLYADWSLMDPRIRPTGFENQTQCPVGINNNDIIFCINGMIYQVNALNGKVNKLPFKNIMPQFEQAAKESAAYFKEQKKEKEIEKFLGDLLHFAMDPKNVQEAAQISENMRGIFGFSYRITTEHVAQGRGQFVSVRNNRPVTLEEMIETL